MKVVAASGATLSTKQELREFKAAAEKYLRDAARSPHAAHETLVRIGVSVDLGDATKNSTSAPWAENTPLPIEFTQPLIKKM